MKQISVKVNLAVRRCKNKGKKITAAGERDPAYLERLVQLGEGNCIFRELKNSQAYLEKTKKDIFTMIRQVSYQLGLYLFQQLILDGLIF